MVKSNNPPPPVTVGAPPPAAPRLFITITPEGEICAWGLEQRPEEEILRLTGNHDLLKTMAGMGRDYCG